MSLNTDLCDVAQGEVTIPPISLKQADTKEGYTVQTALTAFSYYNFFTHGMSPDVVLEKSRQVGVEAFDSVVSYLNQQYEKYCALSGVPYTKLPWKTRVYTWKEFYAEAAAQHGQPFRDAIAAFAEKLQREQPAMDLRYFSLAVTEEVWKWYEDKSPALVLFFGSVFSARIEMTGKTAKERALLDAVEGAVEKIRPEAQRQIKTRMFYPYISDSSFMALCDTRESFDAVAENHARLEGQVLPRCGQDHGDQRPCGEYRSLRPGRAYAHRAGRHGADLPKRAQYHLRGDLVHAQLTVDTHQRA